MHFEVLIHNPKYVCVYFSNAASWQVLLACVYVGSLFFVLGFLF